MLVMDPLPHPLFLPHHCAPVWGHPAVLTCTFSSLSSLFSSKQQTKVSPSLCTTIATVLRTLDTILTMWVLLCKLVGQTDSSVAALLPSIREAQGPITSTANRQPVEWGAMMGLLISKVHRLRKDVCFLTLELRKNSQGSSRRLTKGHKTKAPLLKLSELGGIFQACTSLLPPCTHGSSLQSVCLWNCLFCDSSSYPRGGKSPAPGELKVWQYLLAA